MRSRWNGRGSASRRSGAVLLPSSYSTTFPATENPISEGGVWRHNPNNGWNTAKVRTVGGAARPNALSGQGGSTDDAYALLDLAKVAVPANVEVIVTLDLGTGTTQEHEILLRASDSDTGVTAYECLYNANGGSVQIMRWNGPLGNYTEITGSASSPGSGSTGNQLRATIVGPNITFYWRANSGAAWTQIGTATDSTYANGSAGIAFFATAAGGGSIDACGFTDFALNAL